MDVARSGPRLLAVASLSIAACQDSSGQGHDNDTSGSASDDSQGGQGTAVTEESGPRIEQLLASAQSIDEAGLVTVTAIVTDPNGLDNVAGGLLLDGATGTLYTPFSQISAGTYQAALTWDSIHQVVPIEFADDGTRQLRAEFSDNESHVGSRTLDIQLDCGGLGACGGACTDLDTEQNCGACGARCAGSCISGTCLVGGWSPCFDPVESSCSRACGELGSACIPGGCEDATYKAYYTASDCIDEIDPAIQIQQSCDSLDGWARTDDGGGFILPPEAAVRCCCG